MSDINETIDRAISWRVKDSAWSVPEIRDGILAALDAAGLAVVPKPARPPFVLGPSPSGEYMVEYASGFRRRLVMGTTGPADNLQRVAAAYAWLAAKEPKS